ncbi:ABC transporter substrate-binding protein, partial [Dietzia sp. NPDC055343]
NLKTATGLDEQIAALNRFQEIHNQVMPFTIFANAEEFVAVDEAVKGISPTSSGVMLFDGAYVTNP